MANRRIFGIGESVVYHCVTKTVNGEMLFGDREKEVMRKQLRQVADFSGVELLTYAVMSNHVHVLVRVSERAKVVADSELLRRYQVLYPKPTQYQVMNAQVLERALQAGSEHGKALRKQLTARMGDVSEFMKTLKQRFSIWFNSTHGRFGTLWCERFKSSVVQDCPEVLRIVGAYIELNPVRAKMVDDPKDYRFCGYAEALAGDDLMRQGVCSVVGVKCADQALADYRMIIFAKGAAPRPDGQGAVLADDAYRRVIDSRGTLPLGVLIRQRVGYFTRGAVLGSVGFVQDHIRGLSARLNERNARHPNPIETEEGMDLAVYRRVRQP